MTVLLCALVDPDRAASMTPGLGAGPKRLAPSILRHPPGPVSPALTFAESLARELGDALRRERGRSAALSAENDQLRAENDRLRRKFSAIRSSYVEGRVATTDEPESRPT